MHKFLVINYAVLQINFINDKKEYIYKIQEIRYYIEKV